MRLSMPSSLSEILGAYDPSAPLPEAWTIPAPWYVDPRIAELERASVFSRSWLAVGRADQVSQPGGFLTAEIAGEPLVAVRGNDGRLRAFFNVCRHHAAAVETREEGRTHLFRCPYHGWTYSLEGELKGTPDFAEVCRFEKESNGLVPVETAVWENFVFARLDPSGPPLEEFLGADLRGRVAALRSSELHFFERRRYLVECNWKVFVDNYLDGGYHVPHLHKGLDSVLDYANYSIENGERFCLQSSPIVSEKSEPETGAVRKGRRAEYFWIYPNFMLNWYEGIMDTNLVLPLGVDRTEVIFDFYFADVSEASREKNLASIAVGHRIQEEDLGICKSVQKGLSSRAYVAGRLSARREAGEHLFHRLLAGDLRRGLGV
ncbi:MAG TPA: aromatic ring-hydroxylating dioxygenase subunit alpha [Thermoanaerobaculia bacterium]|nr:aromatic ring-hydroxylating dioxygenase subunit alpha [Thermoanaerobaculia bacterium]